MYAQGSRVPTDLPRAALLAQRGCQLGSERACAMRQQIARLQSGEKELAQESAKVGAGVAQAVGKCNEGEVVFCVMAAFYSGLTVDERTAEARLNLYLDKACAIDSSEACLASLALYEDSPPQIQARYDSRHFIQKTCEKACNAKSWQACYMLGEFNKAGKHMPRDSARAFSFYSRACDGGFLRACGDVGVAYLRDEATPRDMPQVLQALGQGCEAENGGACVALGLLSRHGVQGVPQNLEKALGFFQRACQLGQGLQRGQARAQGCRSGPRLRHTGLQAAQPGGLLTAGQARADARDEQSPEKVGPLPRCRAAGADPADGVGWVGGVPHRGAARPGQDSPR